MSRRRSRPTARPVLVADDLDLGANIACSGFMPLDAVVDARMIAFERTRPTRACSRPRSRRTDWATGGSSTGLRAERRGTIPSSQGCSASRVSADDDPQAITVPTVDIVRDEFDADFIKMDIEGAEWPILADRRLATLRASRSCSGSARMPRGGARAAADRVLATVGYEHIRPCRWRVNGLMWAWRRHSAVIEAGRG